MPGYDRTGPRGQGPMTGRGIGYCGTGRGYRRPGFRRFGAGMGYGRGAGYGRGNRRAYYNDAPPVSPEEEKDMLKEEIEFLRARLGELEKDQQE